jgi:signal peptidase I
MRVFFRFLAWTALILAVIVGLLRVTAIRWWHVPADDPYLDASIAPSIRGGDWIILWRATKPGFGDLVICPEPKAESRVVIGRIVGEAGDTVKIQEQSLIVNNHASSTEGSCGGLTFKTRDPSTKIEVEQHCQTEVLAGGTHLRGEMAGDIHPLPISMEVPQDRVFLASDNRLFPYDSRDFGPVLRSTCTESVIFRLVSKAGFSDEQSRMTYIR